MPTMIRALVLGAALASSAPLVAQELTISALKALNDKIDAATARCDIDTVLDHVAPLAVITLNQNANGTMRILRMSKDKYRQYLTLVCAAISNYKSARANEQISIDGDQAVVTADVTETMVIQGREHTATIREKATIESIDGKLMLVQLVANEVL